MQAPKKVLHSLSKYLAIGFDNDHCLARYNVAEFCSMFYKHMAKALVEDFSYPKEMMNYGKKERCFILNGLVIDLKTGYILKLGKDKVILRAYYGYDRVSQEDLEVKYGKPPKFEIFDPYQCGTEEYECTVSFFECFYSPILAHMIDHKKKTQHLEEIDAKQILRDAKKIYQKICEPYAKEAATKIEQVVYNQDRTKEILQSLKAKGKILFVVSNGPPFYLSLVMEQSLGKDWKSLFDFIVADAKKPSFFEQKEKPFYPAGFLGKQKDSQPTNILNQHEIYVEGSAKILEQNIERISAGKSGRYLFFGDHYSADVLAAERIEDWDGVCIMEELAGIDFGEGYDESYWGNWKYEETPDGKIPTFWYSYMKENVAMCASFVSSVEMLSFYEL